MGKFWNISIVALILFLNIGTYGSSMPYNLDTVGLSFRAEPIADIHTLSVPQICEFKITKIQDVQDDVSNEYSDDDYADGDMPEDWGCFEEKVNEQVSYYSQVYEKSDEDKILWTYISFTGSNYQYAPHSKESSACLKIHHASLNEDERGPEEIPRVDKDIEPSTIGLISFDVMMHLNISSTNSPLPNNPYGTFHFELDDSTENSPTIQLVGKIINVGTNLYASAMYIEKIDPNTGLKTQEEKIFQGAINNFNWMNVKVFFDLYNDVYNITIAQYDLNFNDWLVSPSSTVLRGNQFDPLKYELTNTGYRYAPSHLIDSVDFWVETEEIADKPNYPSTAYVDNLNVKTWKFPAVYANVKLQNSTINQVKASGISLMNNSIISCYQPPKYPSNAYSIEYGFTYLRNEKNPGFITPWIMAPQWVYSIPLYVTNDHNLNARSILNVINSIENPIELSGIMDPPADAPYYRVPGSPMNAQYFELNMEESTAYYYLFKARYSERILLVEYYSDLARAGMIKKIGLYDGSIHNTAIVLLETSATGGAQGDEEIPGYPIESFMLLFGLSFITLLFLKKKKMKV